MISRWHISWTIYNMVCIIGNYNWYYVILVDSHSNIFVWICEATMVLFFYFFIFFTLRRILFFMQKNPQRAITVLQIWVKRPPVFNTKGLFVSRYQICFQGITFLGLALMGMKFPIIRLVTILNSREFFILVSSE